MPVMPVLLVGVEEIMSYAMSRTIQLQVVILVQEADRLSYVYAISHILHTQYIGKRYTLQQQYWNGEYLSCLLVYKRCKMYNIIMRLKTFSSS